MVIQCPIRCWSWEHRLQVLGVFKLLLERSMSGNILNKDFEPARKFVIIWQAPPTESHCYRGLGFDHETPASIDGQSEFEQRPSRTGRDPEAATMGLYDGMADRQPHSDALRFRGKEWLEDAVCQPRLDS